MIAVDFFVMLTSIALLQQTEGPQRIGLLLGQDPPGDAPEIFADGVLSRGCPLHSAPVFTPDLNEVYWRPMDAEGCEEKTDEILYMKRIDDAWTEPDVVSFSSLFWDSDDPAISPDGKRLYFTTHRPSGILSFDFDEKVMYVEREGGGWSSPRSVGDDVNSLFRHWQVSVNRSYDLYFFAEQNVEAPGIYVSRNADGGYRTPERLPDEINRVTSYHPYIAPDESFLLFVRTMADTGDDLFISFRGPGGEWSEAESLGERINSPYHDFCPSITPDGKYLFFLSQREGGNKTFWVDAGFIDEMRPTPRGSAP